jgi:hypothetical protein
VGYLLYLYNVGESFLWPPPPPLIIRTSVPLHPVSSRDNTTVHVVRCSSDGNGVCVRVCTRMHENMHIGRKDAMLIRVEFPVTETKIGGS